MQNAVNIAVGSEQSSVGEAFHDVVFRLLLPSALGLQWRSVLRGRALVGNAVDADLSQLVILAALLELITPNAGLRFEGQFVLCASAEVAFLTVDECRHPISSDQIETPAVHMEEVGIARSGIVGAVQADDVESLILDPDTTKESSLPGTLLGGYVEHQAAHIA